MGIPLKVLIVEDAEEDAALLVNDLRRNGYDPVALRVETADDMRAALAREPWDIIISDYAMPAFNARAALRVLQETGADIPFVILSGSIGETLAVEAMKAGASDYIMKGQTARLIPVIHRELREARERQERRRADDMVMRLAYHDALTGLPNRSALREKILQALTARDRQNRPLAFLLADLNRFKEINDTLGHRHGDTLLQLAARRIQRALSEQDVLARLGGDEFGVLLPAADAAVAEAVVRKILMAFETPILLDDIALEIELSIGVALFPDHGSDGDLLIQRAEVAMYQAKDNLKGYAFYAPEKDSYHPQRLALLGELRRAIDERQIFLAFQPKVDLRTGTLAGLEGLVRWNHPQRGLLTPDRFIALAERTGLIKPLTLCVLREALDQCNLWRRAGIVVPVAVNLSARNLEDLELPDQISELLRIYGVDPAQLELEITENSVMKDSAAAPEVLDRLSRMGLSISIDDFGTGYSSLSHLRRLPIDVLKIDKSFVLEMETDEDAALIVRSTIDLAHNLSLSVVAEGVESKATFERLRALSCDFAQGFYLSRPLPAEAMSRWIRASPWRTDAPKAR